MGANDQSGAEALSSLFSELMLRRRQGWSVVRGQNDLAVRPPARETGRFRIVWIGGEFSISFFDQKAGHWTGSTYVRPGPGAADELMGWAEAAVARCED